MNKKEANEKIIWWMNLPRNEKGRNWDKVLPYVNKYPNEYLKELKERKEKHE